MKIEDSNGLSFKNEEEKRRFYSKWSIGETYSDEHRLEKNYENVKSLELAKRKRELNGKPKGGK